MIDLRKKDHKVICRLAQKIFPAGTQIRAYGSRVKGKNHDTSDLDLVVCFPDGQDRTKSFNQLDAFTEALRDTSIPIMVHVLAWHAIPGHFKKNIQAGYHVLWTVPSGHPGS